MNTAVQMAESISSLLHENRVESKTAAFTDGQIIYRPADPPKSFFILESGIVHVLSAPPGKQTRLLDIIGPKQCFGFAALANLTTYGTHTQSAGDSVAQIIDSQSLRRTISSQGNLTMQLVESLARRLYDTWMDERESVCTDCRARIIKALLHFQHSPVAHQVPGGIELHMTHAQLAQAVGTVRETVSVCLIQMRQERLVQTGRNRIFYDPQALMKIDPQVASFAAPAIAV